MYSKAVDYWSLGHACFVMLCAEWPFGGAYGKGPRAKLHANIDRLAGSSFAAQTRTKEWNNLTKEARDFIDRFLVLDPMKRMSGMEAALHDWLRGVDKPERWYEIDRYDSRFKRDKQGNESFHSNYTITVKCAQFPTHHKQESYVVSSKADLEAHQTGNEALIEMIQRWPQERFLEAGQKFRITIVYREQDRGS